MNGPSQTVALCCALAACTTACAAGGTDRSLAGKPAPDALRAAQFVTAAEGPTGELFRPPVGPEKLPDGTWAEAADAPLVADQKEPGTTAAAWPTQQCFDFLGPLSRLFCCAGDGSIPLAGWLRHSSTTGRHVGKGQPLVGTSWLNRPYHADWFLGALYGDSPINGRVDLGSDIYGGYRLGWDIDHYWGTEVRFAWTQLELVGNDMQPLGGSSEVVLADVNLLYYPWGDSRWRPYVLIGVGGANFNFIDDAGVLRDTTLFGLPVGGGVKYLVRHWLALRADILSNIAVGADGLSTMNNTTLTVGMEVHWGAAPRSYWPWNPGHHVW
ncbi:MAG: hypothetical protein BMS9Abin04_342 [Planctomycetia bacterium]|nr:MAG: hypothetical protein BMS9Abin04_342 [Planctomycetia bacterium]